MTSSLSADFLKLLSAYLALFDALDDDEARLWRAGIDQTPAENLASLIGWWNRSLAVLSETTGDETSDRPAEPLPGFRWDEKRALELAFEDEWGELTLADARAKLSDLGTRLAALLDDPSTLTRAMHSPWFAAFAAHRRAMELNDAPIDADPLALFFLAFTRLKMRNLLAYQKAAGRVSPETPHPLWWY